MPAELILRFGQWLWRRIGAQAAIGFGLAAALMLLAGGALGRLGRASEDAGPVLIGLAGLFAGWQAARRRLGGAAAAPALGGLGAALVTLVYANPLGALWAVVAAARRWAATLLGSGAVSASFEAGEVQRLAGEFARQIGGPLQSAAEWLGSLGRGAAAYDPRAASIIWALVLWSAAGWAGWWLRRRSHGLFAALPLTVILALTLGYTRAPASILFPALAVLFGQIAWGRFTQNRQAWQQRGFDLAEDVPFDIGIWTVVICLGAAGMATSAAVIAPQRVVRATRVFLQTRTPAVRQFGEALGLRRPMRSEAAAVSGLPGRLPRRHLLRGGLELSRQAALSVRILEAGEFPAGPPVTAQPGAGSNEEPADALAGSTLPYLRAGVYEIYTGGGWVTSESVTTTLAAGEALAPAGGDARLLALEVRPLQPGDRQVYFPGELLRVDRPVAVEMRPLAGGHAETLRVMLTAVGEPGEPISGGGAAPGRMPAEGGAYRVVVSITPLDAGALSRSVGGYPPEERGPQAEVLEAGGRYLQLPANLPLRVRRLADEITAEASSPYDRARRIEAFLRRYPYSLNLPDPPDGRDLVDYYLYELQTGYCDYAASAMVVLARAAGLPARLAVGYVLPADAGKAASVITEAQAHSWPEIYFPEWGWVTFEPTGGRPERPFGTGGEAASGGIALPRRAQRAPLAAVAGMAAGLAAAIGLVWAGLERRLAGPGGLQWIYRRLRRGAVGLGAALFPGTTPIELPGRLREALAPGGRLEASAAALIGEAQTIVGVYGRQNYGRRPVDERELEKARGAWRRLRWRLLRLRVARAWVRLLRRG